MSNKEKRPNAQKIRIRLCAYDSRLLDQSAGRIVETAEKSGARVVGRFLCPFRFGVGVFLSLLTLISEVGSIMRLGCLSGLLIFWIRLVLPLMP